MERHDQTRGKHVAAMPDIISQYVTVHGLWGEIGGTLFSRGRFGERADLFRLWGSSVYSEVDLLLCASGSLGVGCRGTISDFCSSQTAHHSRAV